MASDPARLVRQGIRALGRPWPLLLAGLGVVVLGVSLQKTPATPLRVSCLVAGLVMAGLAVSRRLRTASQDLEERVESAGLVALAAFAALVASTGTGPRKEADKLPSDVAAMNFLLADVEHVPDAPAELARRSLEDWDSIRLLLGVLVGVGLFGSVLVLLPRTPRRVVASLLVLFHFGAITTAVTAVPPRDQPAPWVSQQLWIRFYRPYLNFMYLTNAYHFYSPDPGPPSLLWFKVQYEDKSYRWIKLPVRQESPIALYFQRGLALAEYTNNPMQRVPLTQWEAEDWERRTGEYHESWADVFPRRQLVVTTQPLLLLPEDVLPNMQYSEPQDFVKKIVASYARHIARTTPNPEAPQMPVESVRVYRVRHDLINPYQLSIGMDPSDPVFYKPVFLGRFTPDGQMLGVAGKPLFGPDGKRLKAPDGRSLDELDPFLYWYLPMAYVPPNYGKERVPLVTTRVRQPNDKFLDGVAIHAGDTPDLKDVP